MSNSPKNGEFNNSDRPLDIILEVEGMSRTSLGKIEPRLSKYNLLQIKPRKPRSVKQPVISGNKASDQKECSLFNDPEVQEQLQSLILDVFGEKEEEQKTVFNNECEKYSSEFEKFTSNKRESILRFPYLVDRISIKSSTSIRLQGQNDGSGSLSSNPHSRHNIGSLKTTKEGGSGQEDSHSQTACTNLCNDLMNTIDIHLNLASASSDCQSKRGNSESLAPSNLRLFNDEIINPNSNMNETPSNSRYNYSAKNNDEREDFQQKSNPLQKVNQQSMESANQSKSYASSLNESNSNNRVTSCTRIDENKKREFLHSLFGFDKVLNNKSSNSSYSEQPKDKEYSLEQVQSTHNKLSVSNDHFHFNNNLCICTSNSSRSKSKIYEMENFGKRTTSDEQLFHDNAKRSQQQVFYNDFPSEGSIVNRKNSTHQLTKDYLGEKGNGSYNTKQMANNFYHHTDFSESSNCIVHDKIPRSFQMNDEFFDLDPQLSFLLEKSSNSFQPYSNLVEQNVYFCDVSNNIQCNSQHSESAEYDKSNPDTLEADNTKQNQSNVNNTNNIDSRIENGSKNQGEDGICGVYPTLKNNNKMKNRMREICEDSKYDYNYYTEKCCELIYNKENQSDENDEYTREASLKLSYNQENNKMLNSQQASRKPSIVSCNCSRNSIPPSTKPLYICSKGSNKEYSLQNAAYQVNSMLVDETASNTDHNENSNVKMKNYSTKCSDHTNKTMPLSQLISLDEPDYLQHLKKLRWDHIQRISREVQRLESLERFLDACGCGHIMAL